MRWELKINKDAKSQLKLIHFHILLCYVSQLPAPCEELVNFLVSQHAQPLLFYRVLDPCCIQNIPSQLIRDAPINEFSGVLIIGWIGELHCNDDIPLISVGGIIFPI